MRKVLSATIIIIVVLGVIPTLNLVFGSSPNHGPIYILNDNEFTPENGVIAGSGTKDDPYIIANLIIRASGDTPYNGFGTVGIFIANTTKYFIIRNVTVFGGDFGIILDNVSNFVIEDSKFYDINSYAILAGGATDKSLAFNGTIRNNEAWDVDSFTWATGSNFIIENNYIHYLEVKDDSATIGIGIAANDSLIRDNVIENLNGRQKTYADGILIISSAKNVTVQNNTIRNIYNVTYGEGVVLYTTDANSALNEILITGNYISNVSDNGIDIDAHNSGMITQIKITNNTINNCYWRSILVYYNNGNITITNNTLSYNKHHGIGIEHSSLVNIENNELYGNTERGIHLLNSTDIKLINNDIHDNLQGIWIESGSNNVYLKGNRIHSNNQGLILLSSIRTTLKSNVLENNTYSLGIWSYADVNGYIHDIDSSNIIDGRPIYYWVNVSNRTVPSNASFVALINCHNIVANNLNLRHDGRILIVNSSSIIIGNSILENNKFAVDAVLSENILFNNVSIINTDRTAMTFLYSTDIALENVTILGSSWDGIYLYDVKGFMLTNSTISNAEIGINVKHSSDVIVQHTQVGYNSQIGILLDQNSVGILQNNLINSNGWSGIELWNGAKGIIKFTTVYGNLHAGIWIIHQHTSAKIDSSTIYNNSWGGIEFHDGGIGIVENSRIFNNKDGIYLKNTSNVEIYGSIIENNNGCGISIDSSGNIRITGSEIRYNKNGGIHAGYSQFIQVYRSNITGNYLGGILLLNSTNNAIYLNNFINNSDYNAYTIDSTVIWNSPTPLTYTYNNQNFTTYLGNYWSDYAGSDSDNNGIGDSSYVINVNNTDRYPLIAPITYYSVAQGYSRGPAADVLYIIPESDVNTAIQQVTNGMIDMFLWDVPQSYYNSLSPAELDALKLFKSTSAYNDIEVNPVHDADNPYIITVNGIKYFNPFAIRDIRYALNFLINREYIVRRFLGGSGAPMLGGIRPSTSANTHFEPVYNALLLTPEGNKNKALIMINNAMERAQRDLSTMGYNLTKINGTWYFEGRPITVKFIIRIEDVRRDIGLYLADLLEEAGFKVERIMMDRQSAGAIVYGSDPRSYQWNLYTGGWVSRHNIKWPDDYTAWWYSSWYGWLPSTSGWEVPREDLTTVKDLVNELGGPEATIDALQLEYYNTPDKLNKLYNMTVEEITKLLVLGSIKFDNQTFEIESGNVNKYWDLQKISMALGIRDSQKIFLEEIWEYFPVNKERVGDIASDVTSGLWTRWSLITAETPDHVVRVAQYAPTGTLFMDAFNPIGGIQDIYSYTVWQIVSDFALYPDISTGTYLPVRCRYNIETGNITVPTDAILYNVSTDKWTSPYSGESVKAKVTYICKLSNWHDGVPMSLADFKYFIAVEYKWAYKDSFSRIKGYTFQENENNTVTITVYTDNVHPFADDVTAYNNAIWPTLPWQLLYAMVELVENGDNYNITTKYSFSSEDGAVKLDLLNPHHVSDLLKVLMNLANNNSIPSIISSDITDPSLGYSGVISWINSHHHAVISNGPFYLNYYDPSTQTIELRAFRDPTYPFTSKDITEMLGVLDTIPPTILNLNVTPSTSEVNSTVTISWIVNDNTQIKNVTLTISQPDGTILMKTFNPETSSYSYTYKIPRVGTYTATVTAVDEFGNTNKASVEFYGKKTVVEDITISNETSNVTVQDENLELGIEVNETAISNETQLIINATITTNENDINYENVTSLTIAPIVTNTTEENETHAIAPVKYIIVDVKVPSKQNESAQNIIEKYTLKVKYTDEEIQGIDENTLSLYYWNGSAWVRVKDYINSTIPNGPFVYDAGVNTEENYVWAVVDHFSVYALGGISRPSIIILSPENGTVFYTNTTSNVTVTWIAKDKLGIDHYEININNEKWLNVGRSTKWTFRDLETGNYTVSIKAVNIGGQESIAFITFEILKPATNEEEPSRPIINPILVFWMMYKLQRPKFDKLYQKAVELGISNETINKALKYVKIADRYYTGGMHLETLGAFNPKQLKYFRLAYLNLRKAIRILEKAIKT